MTSPEQILANAAEVEVLIGQPTPDSPPLLRAYGDDLSIWLSTMARCVADARYHHRRGIEAITKSVLDDKALNSMPPMIKGNYIKAKAYEYAYLEDVSDRMYSALAKRLEWVRSQLSYAKAEMHDLKYQ